MTPKVPKKDTYAIASEADVDERTVTGYLAGAPMWLKNKHKIANALRRLDGGRLAFLIRAESAPEAAK